MKKTSKERIAELHGQLAEKCAEIEGLRKSRRRLAKVTLRLVREARKQGVDDRVVSTAEIRASVVLD